MSKPRVLIADTKQICGPGKKYRYKGHEPSTDPAELAWAAGFFDGEGCTTVTMCKPPKSCKTQERLRGSIRASLAQVDAEPLIRFHAVTGVGKVRGPYDARSANRKPYYQWNASGFDVFKVLDVLWPYLCSVKQKQAMSNVEIYEEYLEKFPPKVNQYD